MCTIRFNTKLRQNAQHSNFLFQSAYSEQQILKILPQLNKSSNRITELLRALSLVDSCV